MNSKGVKLQDVIQGIYGKRDPVLPGVERANTKVGGLRTSTLASVHNKKIVAKNEVAIR
jgi:hypothetical protein